MWFPRVTTERGWHSQGSGWFPNGGACLPRSASLEEPLQVLPARTAADQVFVNVMPSVGSGPSDAAVGLRAYAVQGDSAAPVADWVGWRSHPEAEDAGFPTLPDAIAAMLPKYETLIRETTISSGWGRIPDETSTKDGCASVRESRASSLREGCEARGGTPGDVECGDCTVYFMPTSKPGKFARILVLDCQMDCDLPLPRDLEVQPE